MAGGPTRQDTYRISVEVNFQGSNFPREVWDKMTGGEVDSDEYKYRPGGMEPPVSLGGTKTTGNVIVSRLYRLVRDHDVADLWIKWVGKAEVQIFKQPLDIEGNPHGKPIVYTGKLKRVTFPEHNSESSDPGLIEIEVSPEGYPVAH